MTSKLNLNIGEAVTSTFVISNWKNQNKWQWLLLPDSWQLTPATSGTEACEGQGHWRVVSPLPMYPSMHCPMVPKTLWPFKMAAEKDERVCVKSQLRWTGLLRRLWFKPWFFSNTLLRLCTIGEHVKTNVSMFSFSIHVFVFHTVFLFDSAFVNVYRCFIFISDTLLCFRNVQFSQKWNSCYELAIRNLSKCNFNAW